MPAQTQTSTTAATTRVREIARIERLLKRFHSSRLQMAIIVVTTGAVGFLSSYFLLYAGLATIWGRYVLAVAMAYLTFLFLLRVWLRRTKISLDTLDCLPDLDLSPDVSSPRIPSWIGGGGRSGGAGASGSFEDSFVPLPGNVAAPRPAATPVDSGGLDMADGVSALFEEIVVVVLVALALAGAAAASFWIVWSAPVFLAELLLDAALAAGLYRRLKSVEGRHWLQTAIRRTAVPALIVAALFGIAGGLMQHFAPDARSIGEVMRHYNSGK